MIKRFIIRGVSKRFAGVKKVAPFKPDKPKAISKFRYDPKTKSIKVLKIPLSSYEEAHKGIGELFLKAGRTTETATFRRLIKKHPKQGIRAHKLAQLKGLKKVQALGKRHGIEGLGAFIKGPKIKPSRIRPRHTRGKDFPDLADDPTIGGVKAYADMPSIKRQLSKMAKQAPAYTAKYLSPTDVRYTIIKKGRFKGSKLKYKV